MLKADLILHPVRMRMIIVLSGRQLTPKQLAAELQDVAPATLYHHLSLLTEAGITRVVEERLVRGTLREKVYALSDVSTILGPEDLANVSKDEMMRFFFIFLSKLIGDYTRYLNHNESGNYLDSGYRQLPFYLSDEEFTRFVQELNAILLPWLKNEPAPGRRQRVLTTILIPEPAAETQKSDDEHF
jgi:DNA-binding transcriptional ArsR family regulator